MTNAVKRSKQLLMSKKLKNKSWLLIGTIALVVIGFIYWRHTLLYPSTDDAYVQANIINMASQVTGEVIDTNVVNNQDVAKGQLLFRIDPQPYKIAVANAQAQLALAKQQVGAYIAAVKVAAALVNQREAELENAQKNYSRLSVLVTKKLLATSLGDDAYASLKVATATLNSAQNQLIQAKQQLGEMGDTNAQIRVAQTTVDKAKLDLSHTTIYAPTQGIISNFSVRVGDISVAGQQQFALVEDNYWWIDTNFKETQLARIKVGEPATIIIDIYPHHKFHGVVESISGGSGATFSLLPAENATGNWVKITQRFTVRVKLTDVEPKYPLRVGASTNVTVDTTA